MFTHLHVHTEFSLLDGMSRIPQMVKRAKALGMDALGLTDHGALYGAVDFYRECKDAGIKPVIGCELYVAQNSHKDKRPIDRSPFHLTVIAKDNAGYRNLIKLVTKANLDGFYYKPRIDKELLAEHAEGLIVLSGCPSAELSRYLIDGQRKQAEDLVRWYRDHVPHFFLEIQRHEGLDFQDMLNNGLLDLADMMDLPLVATNDLHYVEKDDAPLQDILLCIQTNATVNDEKRFKFSDDSFYLKSPDEMRELFGDLPEAIANTGKVASLVDVQLDFSTLHLPQYDVPGSEDADSYLRKLCWNGFGDRFGKSPRPDAKERLEYELDVITKTRYPNYFLVVWDIADFARRNDIIFGVRGSAASSLALYCLGVTEIDPLDYRLVFERFLNIERKEMPDIDMDFQDDRREEAIRYVVQKYGQDHVAQIITFGTLGAKAAIRDVGRALAMPFGEVDRIARLVPQRVGITLDMAFNSSPVMQEAYNADPALRRLIDVARRLEGVTRHASTHAAGVVISRDPLTDHVPLQRPTKGGDEQDGSSVATSQFAMEPLAKLGMLKMDFLGLINYTILANTQKLLRERKGIDVRLKDIPFDDPVTYDLLASGETTATFQLESPGMRRYIKDLRPGNLGELAAMVALYRPGPMEHIGRFIDSKFGRAPIEYPHEDLREILEETYGIIVYQDQVLHVLRRFAGYSLGSADIVRKAMGKKIADLMAKEREKFVAGALARGYERETAEAIFDLIQPFAGYAFNKAHSVSYAVVAYWTAYFKANYPVEFMTCVLNAYGANSDKASAVIAECKRLDIPVLPPDISRSRVEFAIDETDDGTPAIRFGLASIKNVGESAVEDLVAERERKGAFTSLGDFCRRAGSQVANRRVLESLIKVGALDALAKRGSLLASVETVMRAIQREAQLKDSGQSTMFNLFGQSVATPMADITLVPAPDPSANEAAQWERELLGVAVTARPLDALYRHAPAEAVLSLEQLEHEVPDGANVTLVGQITTVRYVMTKQQQRLAFIVLALPNGSVDVGVRSRALAEAEPLLREGTLVLLTGKSGRGRNEELVVWCDRVQEYRLPADDASAPDPEPTGPRLEEWHEPEPALAVAGASPKPPTNAAPNASNMTTPTQPRPAAPAAGSPRPNGNGYGHGKANGNGNGHAAPSSAAPEPPQRRKVLVRLTETEQPEEDAYLLRAVLSLLLEYPGSDGVDLIISSQGKRYRMEMPIITTSYCPELAARIAELFGRQDAVLVQGPAG